MTKNTYTFASVASMIFVMGAIVVSTTGCADHNFDFEEHKLSTPEQVYEHSFTTQFGEIDPEQTWMPWEDNCVIAGEAGDYQIFENSKLIGNYTNVAEGYKMRVSVEFGTKEVMVLHNGRGEMVQLGETYRSTQTRAMSDDVAKVDNTIDSERYLEFTKADAQTWNALLEPGKNNLGKVTQNFEFISNGQPCYIYPLFWDFGNANLNLGLYYYKPDNTIEKLDCFYNAGNQTLLKGINANNEEETVIHNGDHNSSISFGYTKFRSYGIKIELPYGTRYGFYWNAKIGSQTGQGSANEIFSFANYNNGSGDNKCAKHGDVETPHPHGGIHPYSIGGKQYNLLSVDDSDNDFDLNDLVMIIDPTPYIVDFDKHPFTMAFEDMGSIGDFDFNDVVLRVNQTPGNVNATVTLAAAGGTLPIEVCYDNRVITFDGKTEVHDAFGVNQSVMVNTGYRTIDAVTSEVIEVGEESTPAEVARKFSLHVVSESGNKYTKISLPDNVGGGEAPQGFVVNSGSWIWPMERQSITNAYPNFMDWVHSHLVTNWWSVASNNDFTDVSPSE